MIKFVIFDIDGTINDSWKLYPDLEKKMYELKAKGIKMALLTGRDNFTALYFVHNSGFPFDYLAGRGDSGVVINPSASHARDLFDETVIHRIKCGPHIEKEERFLELKRMTGFTDDEILYCEDNHNKSANLDRVKELIHCNIATPATGNQEWLDFVKERGGFISEQICGRGTLEILEHYFG